MQKVATQLRERIGRDLQLPEEIDPALTRLTWVGRNALYIENHGGIREFSASLLRVETAGGVLRIEGEELELEEVGRNLLAVSGRIASASYGNG